MICQSTAPVALIAEGRPCWRQARWVGPDGKVRCSLHHIQEFGHGDRLVRVKDYEPPADAPAVREESIPLPLPGTHAALDAIAAQFNIDISGCTTVAEKKDAIDAAR